MLNNSCQTIHPIYLSRAITPYPIQQPATWKVEKQRPEQQKRIDKNNNPTGAMRLFHIGRSQRLHNAVPLAESCPEDAVGVLEHAVLQRDDDELRSLEAGLDQTADVLRVRHIEGSVNLVQNVHRCRFELQERHDQ